MSDESAAPTGTTTTESPSTPAPAPNPAPNSPPAPANPTNDTKDAKDAKAAPHQGGDGAGGSDEGSSDASYNREASSQQDEAYRNAGYYGIGRDHIGSQYNNYYQRQESQPRPPLVSQRAIEAARTRFAEPPNWEEARRGLCKQRAVLLCGPRGSGRVVAALRAALSSGVEGPAYTLGGAPDLSDLDPLLRAARESDGGFEHGATFLLICPKGTDRLTAAELQRHTDALERADARLFVIVDAGTDLPEADLLAHLVEIAEGPAFGDVLERHLCAEIGEVAALLQLADPGIRQLVDRESRSGSACSVAAALAEQIRADLKEYGFVDTGRMAKESAMRRRGDFATWLASLSRPHTLCHAVALAVFDGHPHEVVSAAAGSLLQRLENTDTLALSSGPDADPAAPALRHTREAWLRRLNAKLAIPAAGSPGLAETVSYDADRFDDIRLDGLPVDDLWRRVLVHVWSQFPIHAELLDWLGELCVPSTEPQRVFIGRAVGLFASMSYDYVFGSALYPWTADKHVERRDVVAHALLYVSLVEPDLADRTRQLLTSLYRQRAADTPESVRRLAAAARIEALSLGFADPVQPVAALTRLLYIDTPPVPYAVGASLADLLIRIVRRVEDPGAEQDAHILLSALESAASDPRRAGTAQFAFLTINIRVVIRFEDEPRRQAWPALLTLTRSWPSVRAPIASLWRRSLYEAAYHQLALAVLDSWAFQAEQDVELRHELLRLVREVIRGDARVRGIVEHRAAEWARPDNLLPTPETQADLIAVIRTEKDRRP